MAIRFRTDPNNQRYGFGLTITREMTKTKSSPEGINVFILSDQISLKIDVYINLRCVYTVRHRDRDREVKVFILLRDRNRCRFPVDSIRILLVSA